MRINISLPYIIFFLALNMVMGELHEQAHISTGWFICGCYGSRDVSSWSTCNECTNPTMAFLSTAMGPLFSYCMMWMGTWWFIKSKHHQKQALGFSLLFANLPFARIFTAIMGGGDEKVFIHHLLGEDTPVLTARLIAILLTMVICGLHVIQVAKVLINKRRWWIITGFLVLPLLFAILYQRMFLNGLLNKGVGDEVFILGTPNLILLHFTIMMVFIFTFRKSICSTFYDTKKL